MLLDVGQRQATFVGAVAAMAWPRSLLEERIKIIVNVPPQRRKLAAAALGCLAVGLLALAAQLRAC